MDLALLNFKKTNVDDIITPIVGDAIEILADMNKKHSMEFDFIFVDANKAEYIQYFNSFDPLLKKGGVIVADNILSHYKKNERLRWNPSKSPKLPKPAIRFWCGNAFIL